MAKITQWAEASLVYLDFPVTHDMFRFQDNKQSLPYLGR